MAVARTSSRARMLATHDFATVGMVYGRPMGAPLGTRLGNGGAAAAAAPWVEQSAYLPSLYFDEAHADFEARGTGFGDAIIPTEAAAPVGPLTTIDAATATEARDALQGGTSRRVRLTANVGAISLNGAVTDCVLDLNGFTADNLNYGGSIAVTRFRIQAGRLGFLLMLSSTRGQDISIVGVESLSTGTHAFYLGNIDRLTMADCVGVWGAGAQSPCMLDGISHGLFVNTALGAKQNDTMNDWATRYANTTPSDHILYVNCKLKGGAANACLRHSHISGVGSWSTPDVRGTDAEMIFENTVLPLGHMDVGASGLVTEYCATLYTRTIFDDDDLGSPIQGGVGAVTSGPGSASWRMGGNTYVARDATMFDATRLAALEGFAIGQGCDAVYGTDHTYSYPASPSSWVARTSYLLGTSLDGDPYAL